MKLFLWTPHVTICFVWILPEFHLNYNTIQFVENTETESVPDFEDLFHLDSTSV